MTLKEIHGKLKEKFGEVIGEWVEPEAGQPWIEVDPGAWREVAVWLKDEPALGFDFLRLVSGVDYTERLEVVYHLFSYRHEHEAAIKLKVPAGRPSAPSVMDVWPAADWLERETYDMLGIGFEGHAGLKRILLPEDWEGYPLRKDYRQPDEYHGITNW